MCIFSFFAKFQKKLYFFFFIHCVQRNPKNWKQFCFSFWRFWSWMIWRHFSLLTHANLQYKTFYSRNLFCIIVNLSVCPRFLKVSLLNSLSATVCHFHPILCSQGWSLPKWSPLWGQESKSVGPQPCPHAMVEMIDGDKHSSLLGHQIITAKSFIV